MFDRRLTSGADPRFDALYAIYRKSIALREQKSKTDLIAMVLNPEYRFFVAHQEDRMAGFSIVFLSTAEPVCLLEYMAVDEAYRRYGVGSELFEQTTNVIREEAGVIPILFEVDSDRGPSPDQDVRRRRQNFYRRLGCRRIADCAYLLPLAGAGSVPEMDLFVHVLEPAPAIQRSTLQRWLQVIYRDVYKCSADDPRIGMMLHGVSDPIQLI